MKNNVIVKLKASQAYEGEEEEVIEYLTEGFLEKRPEGVRLFYKEPIEGIEGIENELVILNPESVTLTRSGEFNTHFSIEKGKRHSSVYETPYGSVIIGVFADEVSAALSEKGGKISLSYTVDSNLNILSQNTVNIELKNI